MDQSFRRKLISDRNLDYRADDKQADNQFSIKIKPGKVKIFTIFLKSG